MSAPGRGPGLGLTASGTTTTGTGTSTGAGTGTSSGTRNRALLRSYSQVAAEAIVRLAVDGAPSAPPVPEPGLWDDDGPADDALPEDWWDDEVDTDTDALVPEPSSKRGPVTAAFALFPLGGSVGWAVRTMQPPGDDPLLVQAAARRQERLERLAGAMARHQPDVARASSVADAYLALRRVSFTELADEIGSPSQSSRDGDLLVRLPAGVVPLTFFRWRRPDNERAERIALELHAVLSSMFARNRRLDPSDIHKARDRVSRRLHEAPDTVRKHLPSVLAVIQRPDVVRSWQARFPFADPVDLRGALEINKGGETVMQLALVGVIGPGEVVARHRSGGVL
jgi:hypothetical protein